MGTGSITPSDAGSEEIARLVRDPLEAWNAHDLERIMTFYAPEYEGVDAGRAKPQRGPQGVSWLVKRYLQAFPDLRFVDDDDVQGNRAGLLRSIGLLPEL